MKKIDLLGDLNNESATNSCRNKKYCHLKTCQKSIMYLMYHKVLFDDPDLFAVKAEEA